MLSLLTSLLLLVAIPIIIYIFFVWNFNYWHQRGVNGPKPRLFLGSFPNLFKQKQHFSYDINDIYKRYKSTDNFVGVYLMRTPQLLVTDPKIIQEVFVTAFKHFHDNDIGKLVDKKKDPLIANNPFILTGADWKEQRALATPGLTATRIKAAYSVMQEVCRTMCNYLENESKIAPKDGFNGKDLALRFTCENVSDSVLGIKAQSFSNNPIPIANNVRKFIENNTIFVIYSLLVGIYPKIIKLYKAKFIPKDSESFFLKLMSEAFNIRKTNKMDRPDIMNHLITLTEKKTITQTELASISMIFLIDGLDTTATVISHCLLLLARNQETQDKLRQEILQNVDDSNDLSFETLNEMPYLNACLHESLRIFSPALWSTKDCTEPFEFTNKDGKVLKVRKGETVILPLYSLHQDPDFYPEPEKFKPERFMPENGGVKKYHDMGVFLGFGSGPRMCLGMRFALVQSKAAISTIVRNFNIKVNPKTKRENKLDPKSFIAIQEGGVWLDFEKIT